MKKAIVYKKDREIGTAQGPQVVSKKGDIEGYFDSDLKTPRGFLFSQGLVEIVDVEAGMDESDAIFVVTPEILGKYQKAGEIDLDLDSPPMIDDGNGLMIVDVSWTKIDTVPEERMVKTDAGKKTAREAANQAVIDKTAKKATARQFLIDKKADLNTPSVAKLAPLVRALIDLLEE